MPTREPGADKVSNTNTVEAKWVRWRKRGPVAFRPHLSVGMAFSIWSEPTPFMPTTPQIRALNVRFFLQSSRSEAPIWTQSECLLSAISGHSHTLVILAYYAGTASATARYSYSLDPSLLRTSTNSGWCPEEEKLRTDHPTVTTNSCQRPVCCLTTTRLQSRGFVRLRVDRKFPCDFKTVS